MIIEFSAKKKANRQFWFFRYNPRGKHAVHPLGGKAQGRMEA